MGLFAFSHQLSAISFRHSAFIILYSGIPSLAWLCPTTLRASPCDYDDDNDLRKATQGLTHASMKGDGATLCVMPHVMRHPRHGDRTE